MKTEGHRLLTRWLAATRTRQADVARGVGRSEPSVYFWIAGKSVPDTSSAVALEKFTRGAVPVEAWTRKPKGRAA